MQNYKDKMMATNFVAGIFRLCYKAFSVLYVLKIRRLERKRQLLVK